MVAKDILKSSLFFLKKFGLFLFVPLFLILAHSYINSSAPQYRVTARVALNRVSAEEAAGDIKSKYLVQKALAQLSYRVAYYDPKNTMREIDADSVPVKLVFDHFTNAATAAYNRVDVVSDDMFNLTEGDTSVFQEFGKPVDEYYGSFRILAKPHAQYKDASFLFKLTDPGRLVEKYYSDLQVEPVSSDSGLTISILAGTPKKGADFINKLIRLYDPIRRGAPVAEVTNEGPNTVNTEKINEDIKLLREKAALVRRQISWLSPKAVKAVPDSERMRAYDVTQVSLFKVIMPYLKKPVDEFVQVPRTNEVYDIELRNELNAYNAMEMRRQRLLADPAKNEVKVDTLDNKMMYLQSQIVENISFLNQQPSPSTVTVVYTKSALLKAKQDSLARLEKDINFEKRQLAAIKPAVVKKNIKQAGSRVIVIDKPESNVKYVSVNAPLVYGLALLAGLFIPFAWAFAKGSNGKRARGNKAINPQKLGERIQNLFAVKQID